MVSEPGSSEPELKLPQTHCSLLSSNPNHRSSLHPVQLLMKKKTEACRVLMVPHPLSLYQGALSKRRSHPVPKKMVSRAWRLVEMKKGGVFEADGSQEVFLVHHPSELKEEDLAHCVEQWRVEKEVLEEGSLVSYQSDQEGSEGPLQATEEEGAIRSGSGVSRQESVQSTLGCEKMKTLSVRLLIMKLSIQACSCESLKLEGEC
ncbi:hypothetical protein Bca101_072025 [Brassica carinata]